MLDGKAYRAHFPDDPAYDRSATIEPPRRLNSTALLEALAALEIEKAVFERLRAAVIEAAGEVGAAARGLAEIDVASALGDLARGEDWVRPEVGEGRGFRITAGRHPVVEQALRRTGGSFVANDAELGERPLWLVTGPNMAGKSTYLRQNALIAVLAQMGSYVPASEAEIGVVDALFSGYGEGAPRGRGPDQGRIQSEGNAYLAGAFPDLDYVKKATIEK